MNRESERKADEPRPEVGHSPPQAPVKRKRGRPRKTEEEKRAHKLMKMQMQMQMRAAAAAAAAASANSVDGAPAAVVQQHKKGGSSKASAALSVAHDAPDAFATVQVQVQGVKGRKHRKMKDPNAPKRPPTSYLLFCKDNREAAIAEGLAQEGKPPTVKVVSRIQSEKWKAASEEVKREYERRWKVLTEEYMQKKKEYEAQKGQETGGGTSEQAEEPEKRKKRGRRPKQEGEPKKPTVAYLWFCSEMKDEARKMLGEGKNSFQILASMWESLDEEGRLKYRELERLDKLRFEREMEDYRLLKMLNEERPTVTSSATEAHEESELHQLMDEEVAGIEA